jgi:hypothetical protein
MKDQPIVLDNKTIAKLAIAIATAMKLQEAEVIGPLTRKVLETLDTLDGLPHFSGYQPKS